MSRAMTIDETREHFIQIRDHMKQAYNKLTEPDSYNRPNAIKMQEIIEWLNTKIGEVTFK